MSQFCVANGHVGNVYINLTRISRKPVLCTILEATVWLFLNDDASPFSAVAAPPLRGGVKLFKLLEAEPVNVFSVLLLKDS